MDKIALNRKFRSQFHLFVKIPLFMRIGLILAVGDFPPPAMNRIYVRNVCICFSVYL